MAKFPVRDLASTLFYHRIIFFCSFYNLFPFLQPTYGKAREQDHSSQAGGYVLPYS